MIAEPGLALALRLPPPPSGLAPLRSPANASTRRSRGPARNAANRQTTPAPSDSYDPLVQTPTKRKDSSGRSGERLGATLLNTMLYEVLVHSSGGDRFTIERDAPLADGDTFGEDSESYRVLAIEPGHGPFAGVIQAERLSNSGLDEVAPA